MKKRKDYIKTIRIPPWLNLELNILKKRGANLSFFIREAIAEKIKKEGDNTTLIGERIPQEEKILRDKGRIATEKDFILKNLNTINTIAEVRTDILNREIRTKIIIYDDYLDLIEQVKQQQLKDEKDNSI